MGGRINSSNVIVIARLVNGHGGKVTDVRPGGKHVKMRVVTRKGNPLTMIVSKARIEPYKFKGWVRQELNRADARAVAD